MQRGHRMVSIDMPQPMKIETNMNSITCTFSWSLGCAPVSLIAAVTTICVLTCDGRGTGCHGAVDVHRTGALRTSTLAGTLRRQDFSALQGKVQNRQHECADATNERHGTEGRAWDDAAAPLLYIEASFGVLTLLRFQTLPTGFLRGWTPTSATVHDCTCIIYHYAVYTSNGTSRIRSNILFYHFTVRYHIL